MPVEILSTPDLYVIEFEFKQHLGVSVIIPGTCAMMAKVESWRLFPEYKRNATNISIHNVEYAEIDWETGRTIVLKRKKRPAIPMFVVEESQDSA